MNSGLPILALVFKLKIISYESKIKKETGKKRQENLLHFRMGKASGRAQSIGNLDLFGTQGHDSRKSEQRGIDRSRGKAVSIAPSAPFHRNLQHPPSQIQGEFLRLEWALVQSTHGNPGRISSADPDTPLKALPKASRYAIAPRGFFVCPRLRASSHATKQKSRPNYRQVGICDPGGIQTHDHLLRRQELYSAELPGRFLQEQPVRRPPNCRQK